MASFKLNIGQKMLRYQKVNSENLKNLETFSYLSNFKFSGIICNDFWIKVKLIRNNFFCRDLSKKVLSFVSRNFVCNFTILNFLQPYFHSHILSRTYCTNTNENYAASVYQLIGPDYAPFCKTYGSSFKF